jgi:hypothetical protein
MKFVIPFALFVAVAAALPAAAQQTATEEQAAYRGTVGVCVRWGVDPHHVIDAVVVTPSGNDQLDQATPDTVMQMRWEKPADGYHGEWVGITLQVAGSDMTLPEPQCDEKRLPRLKPNT